MMVKPTMTPAKQSTIITAVDSEAPDDADSGSFGPLVVMLQLPMTAPFAAAVGQEEKAARHCVGQSESQVETGTYPTSVGEHPLPKQQEQLQEMPPG